MSLSKQQAETKIKILIIGPSGVGKTLFLQRVAYDFYKEPYLATTGIEFGIKKIYINDEPVKLVIWDSAGQERFNIALPKAYYKGAHGIYFAFDISCEKSFEELQNHYKQTMEQIQIMDPNVSFILLGCKSDLEEKRAISYDVAKAFAKNIGMHYIEVSSKINKNCLEAAEHLGRLCYEKIKNSTPTEKPEQIIPQLDGFKHKTHCYR